MPTVGHIRYLEAQPRGPERPRGTLLLLHAFPLNADMWEPQLALADSGWRVIAPHLGGAGGGAGAALASINDYAAEAVDLLDALQIDDAVIGGLSMGGYVAFALFKLAPRYVRGLILADTRPQADTAEGIEARRRMLALVREKGAHAVANEMLPKLLAETTRLAQPATVEHVRAMILSNSSVVIAAAINALMTRPDSTAMLSAIHCPTLIVVGEADALTPPALSEGMHHAIAGSELVKIVGAGHLSNVEQPEAFNAALARFLEHRV